MTKPVEMPAQQPKPDSGARRLSGPALAAALRDCRARTLALLADLSDAQWQVPRQPGLNPPAWELAHIAWFGEFWTQRGPHRVGADGFVHAARPAPRCGPDALFDSARLPHAERWAAAAGPSRAALVERLQAQLDDCIAALAGRAGDAELYFHRLALFHEDMHGEAFCWLRATLGYPAPAGVGLPVFAAAPPVTLPAAETRLGRGPGEPGFAFDNERPGRTAALPACEIDATPVTAGQFLRFVDDGGYDDPRWWPGEAGAWRAQAGRSHPQRWRRTGSGWQQRWFDRWLPLEPAQPVIHVNAWEAEAYARWAGRRLPGAAEWERAAHLLHWGRSVWEWTSDAFQPYPGFEPGPYEDYSAPWFGDHRELRGGAFATHPRLHDARYRNFFRPERCDVFAGFRTATTLH
jgi:ergothioneine biosynthesis protein EgtB